MKTLKFELILILLGFSLAKSYDTVSLQQNDTLRNDNFWNRQKITGNWSGLRETLHDIGIILNFVYKGDIFMTGSGNTPGKSTYLDNIDMILDIDLKKTFGWNGASIFFHGLGNQGGDPAESEGVKQGVSNIAAPNAWKIFQFFIEQKLLNENFSILLGMFDLNSHYDVKMVESLFLNPSHGIGADFAQSGNNGPSIFPTASFGIRLRATPIKNNYIQIAVLDGVPGDINNPIGTHIKFEKEDGFLVCGELGFVKGNKKCIISGDDNDKNSPYSKLGLGSWFYSKSISQAINKPDNWGFYLLLEQDIYQDESNQNRRVSITGRFGIANDEVNQFDNFIGGSITFTSIFTDDDRDQLGFGFSFGHNSYLYRLDRTQKGLNSTDFEKIFELTYKLQLTPSIAIQPDIQYIVSPSQLEYIGKSLIFGSRLTLNF